MQELIAVLGVSTSVFAVLLLVRSLRGQAWNITATYVLAVAWLLNISTVIGAATGATTYVFSGGVRVAVSAGWLTTLQEATTLAIVIVSALFVARGIRRKVRPRASIVWLAMAVVVGMFATAFESGPLLLPRAIALLAIVGAAMFVEGGRPALTAISTFGVTMAITSGLMTIIAPTAAISACTEKCGPLGVIFAGALINGNALGLILALALPAVFLINRGWTRWLLTAYLAAMIAATGSRTALNAVLVLAVVLVLSRPGLKVEALNLWRRAVIAVTAGVVVFLSVFVPLSTTDPTAYTGRGYLWQVTMAQMQGSEIIGLGSQAWSQLFLIGEIAQAATYSTHNQWLDVWYISGFVGLALFAAFFVSTFLSAGRYWYLPATVLIPAGVISITERPWGIGSIDWLTWALLLFAVAAPLMTRGESAEPLSPAARTRTLHR